jgi:hypothetical protein
VEKFGVEKVGNVTKKYVDMILMFLMKVQRNVEIVIVKKV